MFKEFLDEKSQRELKQKEEKENQEMADMKEKIETEAGVESSKVTMWNFQTEYQKLYIAKKMLEKELDQVAQVFEIQTHQQKIINQGLSLKHPDTFIFEDSIRKARFESMESEIHSSQIRIDLGKATENIIQ